MKRCPIGCMWFGDRESITEFTDRCVDIIRKQLSSGGTVCSEQDVFELATRKMERPVHHLWDGENYDAMFLYSASHG